MKLVLAFLIGCSFLIGSVSAISITSPQIELGSFFSNGTHTTYSAKTSSNSIGYINIKNVSFNNYNINRAYIDVQVDSYYSAWFDHHQSTAAGRRTTSKSDFKFYYAINHSLATSSSATMSNDYNYQLVADAISESSVNNLYTLTLEHRYDMFLMRNPTYWTEEDDMNTFMSSIDANSDGQWWQLVPIDITSALSSNPNLESMQIFFKHDTNHSVIQTGTYDNGASEPNFSNNSAQLTIGSNLSHTAFGKDDPTLIIETVPEPSCYGLLLGGLALWLVALRRR